MPTITDLAARSAEPGTTLWDSNLKGFGLRAQKTRKTWIVLLKSGSRRSIGTYPLISLQDARNEAKRLLAQKTLGRLATARITHHRACQDFLSDCAQRLRPKTVRNYTDTLKLHLDFGSQSLDTITTQQLTRKLQGLTPSQKEHAIRVGKTYFTWCMRHGLLEKSPLALMQNRLQPSRERVLTDTELSAVYRTALKGQTPFHKIVALLVLLGQRRGEIAALKWEWINEAEQTITLPATITKNKRLHVIPYGPTVKGTIENCPRYSGSPYVFPASRDRRAGQPATTFNGWGKGKAAFDQQSGISGYTLHDIRRSFATGWQRLGIRLEVTEAMLGHVSGTRAGVVGIYQRHHFLDEMREAVDKWEAYIHSLVVK